MFAFGTVGITRTALRACADLDIDATDMLKRHFLDGVRYTRLGSDLEKIDVRRWRGT